MKKGLKLESSMNLSKSYATLQNDPDEEGIETHRMAPAGRSASSHCRTTLMKKGLKLRIRARCNEQHNHIAERP